MSTSRTHIVRRRVVAHRVSTLGTRKSNWRSCANSTVEPCVYGVNSEVRSITSTNSTYSHSEALNLVKRSRRCRSKSHLWRKMCPLDKSRNSWHRLLKRTRGHRPHRKLKWPCQTLQTTQGRMWCTALRLADCMSQDYRRDQKKLSCLAHSSTQPQQSTLMGIQLEPWVHR